jgi:hypothetical protein
MPAQNQILLPEKVINQSLYSFYDNLELPDWIHYYHPNAAKGVAGFHEKKMIPSSQNTIFYKENALLLDQAEYLVQRLSHYDRVNIYEIFEVSGISSLPFTVNLLETGQLHKYIPVTVTNLHNQHAIAKFKESTLSLPQASKVKYDSLQLNIETSSFNSLVVEITSQDEQAKLRSANVFLLMNSYLGNSLYPQRILKHLYESMLEGDYLVIAQGIYTNNIEDQLVHNYSNIFAKEGMMVSEKELAKKFSSNPKLDVIWDDSEDNPGVRLAVKVEKDTQFFGIDVAEGSVVKLFRSQRFIEHNLKKMIQSVGFRLVNVTYGDDMDNGLYFAVK